MHLTRETHALRHEHVAKRTPFERRGRRQMPATLHHPQAAQVTRALAPTGGFDEHVRPQQRSQQRLAPIARNLLAIDDEGDGVWHRTTNASAAIQGSPEDGIAWYVARRVMTDARVESPESRHEADTPPADVIVISDLHIGRGKNPATGRYFNLEAFFYDRDFERFCRYICDDASARGTQLRLILNGDVFDFLRVEPVDPTDDPDRVEKRRRDRQTPAAIVRIVSEILAGHPGLVRGLAYVLRFAEKVVFLPGNHDLELQWSSVQNEVRRALLAEVQHQAGEEAAKRASSRLHFEPWFYHEPGRLWVEHGCQYDPENSYTYLLRSGIESEPDSVHQAEYDLPLGNFFQRYLYNAFGHITFIVPSSRANVRYSKWLLGHEPRLLFRVLKSHVPFLWQVGRRMARYKGPARRAIQEAHERELAALAASSGLGDKVRAIDDLKQQHADVVAALRALAWQLTKLAGVALGVAVLSAGLWFAGWLAINQLRLGFGVKTLLLLMFNFFMLLGLGIGAAYGFLRTPAAVSPRPLRRAAQRIIEILDVPIVAFGHTHDEEVWPLRRPSGERAWYYNTGTWIAVFTHDVLLPRERVQFTFLRVRGQETELLHWSPGRAEPLPVILLDEGTRDLRQLGAPPTTDSQNG